MEPQQANLNLGLKQLDGRKAPIPRPWLTEKRPQNEMDFGGRPGNNSNSQYHLHHLIIMDKPQWNVSWDKLTSCFCIRDQMNSPSSPNKPPKRRSDAIPFPAFPALRRDSSGSYTSGPELFPSTGSVSSFTESDSDSSSCTSFSSHHDEALTAPSVTSQARMSIPKPPMIGGSRSRSTGLPPLNPSSSVAATPQPPVNRRRADTGEYTRTSATTNTSRHRRQMAQFPFDTQSMEQIWQGTNKSADAPLPPPTYVLCQGDNIRQDSGFTSSGWEDSSYDAASNEKEEDQSSSFMQPELQFAPNSFMPPNMESSIFHRNERRQRRHKRHRARARREKLKRRSKPEPEASPIQQEHQPPCVYLRTTPEINNNDNKDGCVVAGGWVAASTGKDNCLTARLQQGEKLKSSDIFYLSVVKRDEDKQPPIASILLHDSHGSLHESMDLERNCTCESREISGRVGRCVTVTTFTSTPEDDDNHFLRILPVSLDDSFFIDGHLVPSNQFRRIHDRMFVSGKGKVYAPDEQHDAATYIMFSIDALIKNSPW